jgi:AcrR family transcriptional regulator
MASDLPRTLKVLWGVAERPARGPQPTLSLDRIVATAIEIADRDGLAALSMARLAERLGCAPMSLYRHVANKDELLVFMQNTAPGEPPVLPPGWRDGLATWVRALRGVLYAHPWILQATAGRPPLEPGQLAWLDRGLSAFRDTRLSHRERGDLVLAALYLARGEAHINAVLLSGPPDVTGDYGTLLARFVTADRFPALAEAIAAGEFRGGEPDNSFEIGLARLLDGIELLITARGDQPGLQPA